MFADLLASQQQSTSSLPPVHLWHPEFSGDIDIRVDREGRWFHEGGEIKRPALVKLFASILICEEGSYFLVTPVEKWRIQVELAPLFVVSATRELRDGLQAIVLTTRTEDVVVVDAQHPLRVDWMPHLEQPLPLVTVRDNLTALISRNVFYQLVEWATEESDIIEGEEMSLSSMGKRFSLGMV